MVILLMLREKLESRFEGRRVKMLDSLLDRIATAAASEQATETTATTKPAENARVTRRGGRCARLESSGDSAGYGTRGTGGEKPLDGTAEGVTDIEAHIVILSDAYSVTHKLRSG